jgi:hypothetical protein
MDVFAKNIAMKELKFIKNNFSNLLSPLAGRGLGWGKRIKLKLFLPFFMCNKMKAQATCDSHQKIDI